MLACGVLLALVLVSVSGSLYFLAYTEAGLQAVTQRLGRIGATTVRIEGATGTLARGVHVDVIDVDHPRAHTRLENVRARLSLPALLWRTIAVSRLEAARALVEVRPGRPRTGPPTPMRFLPYGLTIDSDDVRIASGTLVLISGRRYDATALEGATTLVPKRLTIYRSALTVDDLRMTGVGALLAADPLRLEGDVHMDYRPGSQPQWLANAHVSGDLEKMPIRGSITAPLRADFTGNGLDLTDNWHFAGDATLHDLDITVWGGGNALGHMSGRLAWQYDRKGFGGQGAITAPGLDLAPLNVKLRGHYDDRGVTLEAADITHPGSNAHATTAGTVTVQAGGPRVALHGDWQRFRWPLAQRDAPVRSAAGRYTLSGVLPYAFTLEGELAPADLPAMQVSAAKGSLFSDHAVFEEALVQAYDGTAQVAGEATWNPQDTWKLRGSVRNLNPAHLRADLPGSIAFGFEAEGREFRADAPLSVVVRDLGGRVRGRNASGSGSVARNEQGWEFSAVDLRLGTAHLTADGTLGETRDLRFSLNATDLSLLAADARGRIEASGSVKGTATEPVLAITASGADFKYQDVSLRSLEADLAVDLRAGGPTQGKLRSRDLRIGTRIVDGLDLDVHGTAAAHRIDMHMVATQVRSEATAQGAYADGTWQGTLGKFDIDDHANLAMQLAAPVRMSFSAQEQRVEQFCMNGTDARLCAQGESSAAGWKGSVELHNLPLRTFTAGLGTDVQYDGRIELMAQGSAAAGEPWVGKLNANLDDALVRHRLANGREERFALGTGRIEGTATPATLELHVGLDAGASGKIESMLEAQRNGDDWHEFPVRGSLTLETDGLGIMDVYVADIDRIAGHLTTHVNVAGTLGSPRLDGELKLTNGEVDLYQINLALRDTTVNARFNDTSLDIDGSTRAGEGNARVKGRIAWRDRLPYGELHIEGENLLVANIPEVRIQASPKLDFRIDGRRIDASGEVRVPYARLEPAEITNAVRPSADEVLVGARNADPSQQFQVTSNIGLFLEDRVTIATSGLTGRLTGDITVLMDDQGLTRGSGDLSIAEGKYVALGRNLDIERGRLIFANVPLSDPGVDMRAVKVFTDVTAGVNVRGTLRQPRMTFFSNPSLPQSQVVSLLLAGGSLESVQSSRGAGARNDLAAQGAGILAQQLGGRVGIEDIGLESDINNDTSLVLGKYLSPRLYVSYGISLAEVINTLKLRYTIGDRWTVKMESGKARSADLVFTIQK